jgi:hypothetical protein
MPRSIVKGFDPNNVQFDLPTIDATRASIGCTVGDYRYHIWVNPRTLELASHRVLYKNPVKRSLTDRATRKLSVAVGRNADLVAAMQKAVRDRNLVAAAIARLESEHEQRLKDNEEHARLTRIRDAGVPLYEALKGLVDRLGSHPLWAAKLKQAEAAIKLAEKGNAVNTVQPGELDGRKQATR